MTASISRSSLVDIPETHDVAPGAFGVTVQRSRPVDMFSISSNDRMASKHTWRLGPRSSCLRVRLILLVSQSAANLESARRAD
jgi:hypothetical protein